MTKHKHHSQEYTCPSCHEHFAIQHSLLQNAPKYCPYCNTNLYFANETTLVTGHPDTMEASLTGSVTLVAGHMPEKENIQFSIGPYQILRSIGTGGMGEVLLAYDTSCGRRIALKRIRTDLVEHKNMHNRFLKEARVTSQLTHPAIIPIYTIHSEENLVYYTMPYVEGETLKQILRQAKIETKKNIKHSHATGPIPALTRIFLSVCQAVAYAHSKGVLHRDLKPENIIVGRYGEVLILDWGLAKLIRSTSESVDQEEESEEILSTHPLHGLTHLGKVVGTVTYMAPERALGQPATFQTDVYSLGVTLYQILTLRLPFRRGTLKEFRKNFPKEVLLDPMEVAPHRDVPKILSQICCKCLSLSLEERYQTVDDLIHDIENYIEGRSEWFHIAELDIHRKSDWEFQENVLIAEHMAITRGTDVSDWVSLMISKISFPENTKLEAKVKIGEKGHGIGFLMSIPEAAERIHLNSGYCLWLGSDRDKSTKLLRATVEVMYAPEIFLQRHEWYLVRVEKIDNNIHFYLNDVLQFSYISHLPLTGTHLGLLTRDADYEVKDFIVSVGSQSIKVNCLAVPDAFLAHNDYATALSEYRRIGYSFPGTAEGREGMFRAGITLLEEAKTCNNPEESAVIYEQALDEFGKLHNTPGAPLEYLGKALVYQNIGDYEEEIKCFELAYRRYPQHPLLPVLQEQLVYRMHESSHANRKATYYFVLLAVRHLPMDQASSHTKKLFSSLYKHWEPLYIIEVASFQPSWTDLADYHNFAIQIAFWLAQPYTLIEIINDILQMQTPSIEALGNALFALLELGSWDLVSKHIEAIEKSQNASIYKDLLQSVNMAIQSYSQFCKTCQAAAKKAASTADNSDVRLCIFLMQRAIGLQYPEMIQVLATGLQNKVLPPSMQLHVDCNLIWAYYLQKNWTASEAIFEKYPMEELIEETSLLYFLYGCYLYVIEGPEIANVHFGSILEVSFPRSWSLFNHFYNQDPELRNAWLQSAFLWEKRQFYRQYSLFYHCIGDISESKQYQKLEKQEYLNVSE